MFYIRADGNSVIGMGHIMRCMSIADAATQTDINNKPVFITACEEGAQMIKDRGYDVILFDTDYQDMESELPKLSEILQKQDIILVDSYQVTVSYYKELGKLCHTACFEDMGEPYPVELLINYNIYGPGLEEAYLKSKSALEELPKNVLLGVEYMPLRKEFSTGSDYIVKDKVKNVLVTTGGSDPYFVTDSFCEAFLNSEFIKSQDIVFHVVSGPFNKYKDELIRKYGNNKNIVIHENVKDMKSLMLESDVVITATGSTIYEVSALGVPMICFYFAENQRQGAEAFEKLTPVVNGGCFASEKELVVNKILKTLEKCILEKEYRELLRAKEMRLVDGKGARKLAKCILGLV